MKKLDFSEKILYLLFAALVIWWAVLYFYFDAALLQQNLDWAATYQLLAIVGGIVGLQASRSWGGFRSQMGKAISFLALGLLLQALGQSVFSYYNIILGVEIPYPSIADVGFFGSVILYIVGVLYLARVAGASFALQKLHGKGLALVVPGVLLISSYSLFLSGYEFDWSNPVRVILDFGYPIGQALYVSVAVVAYMLSKKFLGGIMRMPVVFIFLALVVQYVADSNFLYQATTGSWINGGYGDLIYAAAYFFMAIGLAKTQYVLKSDDSSSQAKV
jgi:hypothetical protein